MLTVTREGGIKILIEQKNEIWGKNWGFSEKYFFRKSSGRVQSSLFIWNT